MPDITMCVGKYCKVKNKCYRSEAEPTLNGQYWTDFSIDNIGGVNQKPNPIKRQKDCESFLKIWKK